MEACLAKESMTSWPWDRMIKPSKKRERTLAVPMLSPLPIWGWIDQGLLGSSKFTNTNLEGHSRTGTLLIKHHSPILTAKVISGSFISVRFEYRWGKYFHLLNWKSFSCKKCLMLNWCLKRILLNPALKISGHEQSHLALSWGGVNVMSGRLLQRSVSHRSEVWK